MTLCKEVEKKKKMQIQLTSGYLSIVFTLTDKNNKCDVSNTIFCLQLP